MAVGVEEGARGDRGDCINILYTCIELSQFIGVTCVGAV